MLASAQQVLQGGARGGREGRKVRSRVHWRPFHSPWWNSQGTSLILSYSIIKCEKKTGEERGRGSDFSSMPRQVSCWWIYSRSVNSAMLSIFIFVTDEEWKMFICKTPNYFLKGKLAQALVFFFPPSLSKFSSLLVETRVVRSPTQPAVLTPKDGVSFNTCSHTFRHTGPTACIHLYSLNYTQDIHTHTN